MQVTVLIIYRDERRELQRILDDHFNQLLHNRQLKNIILNGITNIRQLTFIGHIFISIICAIYVVTPMIFTVKQHLQHVKNVQYILPYQATYPFTISPNGMIYKLVYIFEISAMLAVLPVFWGTQPLYSLYVFQIIGQLKECEDRIKNLDMTSNDHQMAIRQCVDQYSRLNKCCDLLEKIFGNTFIHLFN